MVKNGPGDPVWGWKMLMHDLRNPEQPDQSSEKPIQQPSGAVTNIVNYPPMATNQFHFASVLAIILTVSLLIIAGMLLWKTGAIDYLIETFRSLI